MAGIVQASSMVEHIADDGGDPFVLPAFVCEAFATCIDWYTEGGNVCTIQQLV